MKLYIYLIYNIWQCYDTLKANYGGIFPQKESENRSCPNLMLLINDDYVTTTINIWCQRSEKKKKKEFR